MAQSSGRGLRIKAGEVTTASPIVSAARLEARLRSSPPNDKSAFPSQGAMRSLPRYVLDAIAVMGTAPGVKWMCGDKCRELASDSAAF